MQMEGDIFDGVTWWEASGKTIGVGAFSESSRPELNEDLKKKSSFLGIQNEEIGRGKVNVNPSNDFHSEPAFIDMASSRYVCPLCALKGVNLASNTDEKNFISRITKEFDRVFAVDSDFSVKIRASAEILFPPNKIMPLLDNFQRILMTGTGMKSIDATLGTSDYDLLRVIFAIQANDQAATQKAMQTLANNKPDYFRQLLMARTLEADIPDKMRVLTPMFCSVK